MKINFTRSQGLLSFSDALHLEDDHGLTDEQIEAMKDERFANWLAVVRPTEETPAEDPPREG